jgi:hypothetical protein
MFSWWESSRSSNLLGLKNKPKEKLTYFNITISADLEKKKNKKNKKKKQL